jgi:hypothetical protein
MRTFRSKRENCTQELANVTGKMSELSSERPERLFRPDTFSQFFSKYSVNGSNRVSIVGDQERGIKDALSIPHDPFT